MVDYFLVAALAFQLGDLHSHYGEAFDTGPREKPWVIEGIGVAHFPITTKNPEVQKWFDQGNELLHSFWDYEAERSFRWCLKLEPDNAMAYWGLARAYFGKGDLEKAEKSVAAHAALKSDLEKNKQLTGIYEIEELELKARDLLARGDTLEGLQSLTLAAEKEFENQRQYADPPTYPEALYNSLGEAYLNAKSPMLAAEAFEKGLTLTKNDLFSLSGLVRAYAALGEKAKAEDAMGRLLFVTADADKGLAIVARAVATGVKGTPHDSSPKTQRNYLRTSLEKFGPNRWDPYPAPALDVKDASGKRVTLDQFKGKNVVLVFYLGAECAHCMKQLRDMGAKKGEWDALDTVVLAVSSAGPAQNAGKLKSLGELPAQLLSDEKYANARRFHSYDDFEEMELHSTILIDKQGRVRWARNGGEPFGDMAFLTKQLEEMNKSVRR